MLRAFPVLWFQVLACTVSAQLYRLPFEELFQRSAVVIEGRVIAQQSFWDNGQRNIYTSNLVEVSRVYKGHPMASHHLEVITRGGIVGDRMELVSESVQYAVGDCGLFCLIPCPLDLPVGPAWENYGSPHGFFRYDVVQDAVRHPFYATDGIAAFRERVEALTGAAQVISADVPQEVVVNERAAPSISSFSPTSISAGTGDVLTINGSGFGSTPGSVRFINSNTGSAFSVDASDITSWSDNLITVVVPSTSAANACAGTGPITVVDAGGNATTSSTNLTVTFGYTNFIYSGNKVGAKLANVNGLGGMTYTLSTTLCTSSQQDAVNAIGRALREWRCVSGVNWRLNTSTTTVNAEANDGISVITYDVGSPLPGGVLGRATSYYVGCSHGGGLHWRVVEVDINMRQSGVTWYFCDSPSVPGGSFDFQSVVFHEFGHGHQLQHIVDNTAVMHRSIGPGQARRVLNSNEESGADYVLGLPANPCGPGAMTLLSHPACLGLTPPSACNGAGPCTAPLPVELVFFTARAVEGGILLTWETATERDNDFFTLERSSDAVRFQSLARIRGAGTSTERRRYEFLDSAPSPGINYYRLWQTDYDGTQALLHMVSAEAPNSQVELLRVFPNPIAGEQVHLDLAADLAGVSMSVVLCDALGREVLRRTLPAEPALALNLAPYYLPAGLYVLRIWLPETRQWLGPVRFWKP